MMGAKGNGHAVGMDAFSSLSSKAVSEFLHNIHCGAPVSGHTHNFYRYPARFSPQFARAAINLFSSPGDTVFDPFSGGGTSAVEALLAGRKFVGCDVNQLACFVARVKTTPLANKDIAALREWGHALPKQVNLHRPATAHEEWAQYQRNVPWWLRKVLEASLSEALKLPAPRQVNSEHWQTAWPELDESASPDELASVAYKSIQTGSKIIVFYSTVFGPYKDALERLKTTSAAKAQLFTTNYEVWIGYHAILQFNRRPEEKAGIEMEKLDLIDEADRVRVARMQVKQAAQTADLQHRFAREKGEG